VFLNMEKKSQAPWDHQYVINKIFKLTV